MTRKNTREAIQVQSIQWNTEYRCDKCKRTIYRDPQNVIQEAMYANELIIALNQDVCVNQKFRRDYCNSCLESIWNKICKLIDANPNDDSGSDFEDEDE